MISTAKRLRLRAQGCFNPGLGYLNDFNRKAVASFSQISKVSNSNETLNGRNPFRVDFMQSCDPGLRQPWALGRNRFAVKHSCCVLSVSETRLNPLSLAESQVH